MLWCGRLQPPVLRLWVLNLLDAGTQQLILQQCGVGQAVFAIVRGASLALRFWLGDFSFSLILWKFTLQLAPAREGMKRSPCLLGEDTGELAGVRVLRISETQGTVFSFWMMICRRSLRS